MKPSKVYFSKILTPENVIKMYDSLGVELKGKIAVKVHSGEQGNQNYLRPEFLVPIVKHVNGTIVECNTAYGGARNETEKHLKLLKEHQWNDFFNVDLLDAEGPDIKLEIPNGKVIKENYIGKNMKNYDSLLVISHFKGHPMGGFGGALKQLSIGCASSRGKSWIHSAGKTLDQNVLWDNLPKQELFLEAVADAASSVVNMFKNKCAFINIMVNMSVDCDCCSVAEDPCIKDIGMLASLDPIALDQACVDMVYASKDEGRDHFIERIESRKGIHTIEAASELGFGSREYELINLD